MSIKNNKYFFYRSSGSLGITQTNQAANLILLLFTKPFYDKTQQAQGYEFIPKEIIVKFKKYIVFE